MCIGRGRLKGENEGMDDKKRQHEEDALDEALRESFPASDPIAVHPQVPPPDPDDKGAREQRRSARRKRPTGKRKTPPRKKKAGKKRTVRRRKRR